METRSESRADRRIMIACDMFLVCSLLFFSQSFSWAIPAFKRSLDPGIESFVPFTTRILLTCGFIAHIPLVLMLTVLILNLLGKVLVWRVWAMAVVFVVLLLTFISTMWGIGASAPFWNVPIN